MGALLGGAAGGAIMGEASKPADPGGMASFNVGQNQVSHGTPSMLEQAMGAKDAGSWLDEFLKKQKEQQISNFNPNLKEGGNY